MVELGRDIAGVEIDDDGLHLQHIGGARQALLGDGARDDVDRRALAIGPTGEGGELFARRVIGRDPDVVRSPAAALTLVDEAAERNQPLAPAEDHVEEGGDLLGVGIAAERLSDGGSSLKSIHGLKCRMPSSLTGPALQQRSAQGQNRHSKKSGVVATRGSSSPASVACRIRTARSDMLCASAASKGTSSWWSSAVSLLMAVKSAGASEMRDRALHVGLVERDLGGVDGLGLGDAVLDAGAPVLRVHRLAFPERGNGEPRLFGTGGDDAVDMTADAPAGDGEAELAAIGPVALAGGDRTRPP